MTRADLVLPAIGWFEIALGILACAGVAFGGIVSFCRYMGGFH